MLRSGIFQLYRRIAVIRIIANNKLLCQIQIGKNVNIFLEWMIHDLKTILKKDSVPIMSDLSWF
jgi:hypothetical protein